MKKYFTRLLASALAVLIVTLAMEGFDKISTSKKIDKLAGTYMTVEQLEADLVESMLVNHDFYPEEIALIDLNSQTVSRYREFRSNETYTYYYDVDGFRNNVETFFRQAYDSMYEGRASLSDVYGVDFSAMTKEEFQAYYASLYSKNSFDELVASQASNAYNYEELTQETGTFSIEDDKIICKCTNPFSTSVMRYDFSGNTLTLNFSDGVEVYTRIS